MVKIIKDFIHEEKGQGFVEYILIIVVIALLAFKAYQGIGKSLTGRATDTKNKLDSGDVG